MQGESPCLIHYRSVFPAAIATIVNVDATFFLLLKLSSLLPVHTQSPLGFFFSSDPPTSHESYNHVPTRVFQLNFITDL